MPKKFDVTKHTLVPKHSVISEREKKELIEKYSLSIIDFPKISPKDSAIQHLKVKEGDIVKVTRLSKTAGEAVFYRRVTNA